MKFKREDLSDVAAQAPAGDLGLALSEVGLENVQMLVLHQGRQIPARGEAAVSLVDHKSRGIHMSRLFKILTLFPERELSWDWLSICLDQMLQSHVGLSDAGHIQIALEWPVLRRALLSPEVGWRTYPVAFRVDQRGGQRRLSLSTRVLYSSTCPCSASLAQQAWQSQFERDFTGPAVSAGAVLDWLRDHPPAFPHSQRSEARINFVFAMNAEPISPEPLIDVVEKALGTPVQAAVKREDEQEFGRLNAMNLMFCEDAARKLKAALSRLDCLDDFSIEVRHFESLHAHDVVARVGKNEP